MTHEITKAYLSCRDTVLPISAMDKDDVLLTNIVELDKRESRRSLYSTYV